ncbi:putative deoxyribonuclease TATDN2 [Mercenaria mercenaria]|uniref:putative deoxyribonuclease TATDN2 n=1 Tax=Mercenaria mercenaria TaxID=6596 RepID=UPI00234FA205|nr:putative deoxyribonuclease TATDN2 [Mercenaria mercenaria]
MPPLCRQWLIWVGLWGCRFARDVILRPEGNDVTALVHWRFLLSLMSMLERHQVEKLGHLFQLSQDDQQNLPKLPEAFDSHCHLDRTMREWGMTNPSLKEMSNLNPLESHEVHLVGVVGVFCDPETYPTQEGIKSWSEQGVVPVVGIHPRKALTDKGFSKLAEVLQFPEVAGLGEIGLDRTEPAEKWAEQLRKVEQVLTLLQPEHVLVIHCRSLTNLSDESLLTMFYMLQSHPSVSKKQLIHLHCFTGSLDILQKWLEVFPNTYVGFTVMICKSNDYLDMLRKLESSRLLLETDAPYFSPPRCKKSNPYMIGWVASRVAEARGQSWGDLLKLASNNAKRLYIEKLPPVSMYGDESG